jgi:hypothetical protein
MNSFNGFYCGSPIRRKSNQFLNGRHNFTLQVTLYLDRYSYYDAYARNRRTTQFLTGAARVYFAA